MVSIIVPVYNVENYIDRCLESVVKQTYTDIEILVMEAKSTDRSLEKVLAWAKDDDRFTIVSRRDGGLGPARNYALQIARGEFVIFLDSDDWLDLDYVEKTVHMIQTDPEIDIVMTGFYMHSFDDEVRTCIESWKNGIYDDLSIKKQIMVYGNNSMWSKLIRKDLLIEYAIEQPALPYEDLAVYPAIIAASRMIGVINDTFLHYQMARPGSLMGSTNNLQKFAQVIEYSERLLKESAFCERYLSAFYMCMYRHFVQAHQQVLKEQYPYILKQELRKDYFAEKFRGIEMLTKFQYVVYGGFSSRWTVHRLFEGKERLKEHYTFTTLASQMCDEETDLIGMIQHDNTFRLRCIDQDMNKAFSKRLSSLPPESEDDTLYFFDFINECQDIVRINELCYITMSEALVEAVPDIKERYPVISWDSGQYWDLWKLSCDKLIGLLKDYCNLERVVLFQIYLTKCYKENDEIKLYEEQAAVDRKNQLLCRMYSYFHEKMPEVKCYEVADELLYTDVTGQELIAQPEYMNAFAYNSLWQRLEIDLVEEQHGEFTQ